MVHDNTGKYSIHESVTLNSRYKSDDLHVYPLHDKTTGITTRIEMDNKSQNIKCTVLQPVSTAMQ